MRVPVRTVTAAVRRLAEVERTGDAAVLRSAVCDLCLSIALHRAIAQDEEDAEGWDERPSTRIAADDELVAGAIDELGRALASIDDPPVTLVAAVIMRGLRGADHSPRSSAATVRLLSGFAGRVPMPSSAAVLSAFGDAIAGEPARWSDADRPSRWDQWPLQLRWSLIDLWTIRAHRERDVVVLEQAGAMVRDEIIGLRPTDARSIRRWLGASASARFEGASGRLADTRLQVLDALNLRMDEPDIAVLVTDLERCPSPAARADLLRTLWDLALHPDDSGVRSILARIEQTFVETSAYERRVAALGRHLRSRTLEGFEAAAELLEGEAAWLSQASLDRVPWVERISTGRPGTDPDAAWGPSAIFASALRRLVLIGGSLSVSTAESVHAERADALLHRVQETIARRGGDGTFLADHHPVWVTEQRMLEAERLIDEGRLDAAFETWFEVAHAVRERAVGRVLRRAVTKTTWSPAGKVDRGLLSAVVHAAGARTDAELELLSRDLLVLGDHGTSGDAQLVGLRTPEGEGGGAALEALVGAFDAYREAEFWRSQMRQRNASHRPWGGQPALQRAAPIEIIEWLSGLQWSTTEFMARLMLELLDESGDGTRIDSLRQEGWFERSMTLDLTSDIWAQLRSPDVHEVLGLRDRAAAVLASLVDASGGWVSSPSPGDLRGTVGQRPIWDYIRDLSDSLGQQARGALRSRGHDSFRDDGLVPVINVAQELREALIADSQTERALELIALGHRMIGDLGHPFHYMAVIHALIGDDRAVDAAVTLQRLRREGALVDLRAVTLVVSALIRRMTAAGPEAPSLDRADHLELIEGLAETLGMGEWDAMLYSRLVVANLLLGRRERCEELATAARELGVADARLEVQLLRARVRLDPDAIDAAMQDAERNGASDVADLPVVVAQALGAEGLVPQGTEWVRTRSPDTERRVELFESFMEGVALEATGAGRVDVEAIGAIQEGMYSGRLPITGRSLVLVLGTASRIAMSGTDSERLVVAQEAQRLVSAAEAHGMEHFDRQVIEQMAWLAKWTRSGRLAVDAFRLAEETRIPWSSSLAGRLIEALVFSGDVSTARRLLVRGLEVSESPQQETYLYNVFLSLLRGRSFDDQRSAIVAEMQARGLELDRFSRAEIGLALAAGGGFEDESRMLRGSSVEKWNELVGPLREGAKLFEPIVARLRLELRTLGRALEAGRPADQLLERCQDVAEVTRDLAETTREFQEAVSADADGAYSPTRYSITSDIVHELSQPAATLGLQVRELRRALESGDVERAGPLVDDLSSTAQVLGRKLKSYRDSLADADSVAASESEVEISRAFERAVETLDPELRGSARIIGLESLKRDLKYQRELVVRGNLYLLQRAFFAMLTNSLEAMGRAGVDDPVIRVEGLYHPTRLLEGAEHGTIQLFISDSGPGIPREIADEIFKAGFSTRRQRGLGLGLATVAAIVELHGGVVQLVSPESARFIIVLPAADLGQDETPVSALMHGDEVSSVPEPPRPVLRPAAEATGARVRGTIIRIDPDRGADGVEERLVRGWILIDGLDVPISFFTDRRDVSVGVDVELSVRQTRSGPIGEDLVVSDPEPSGERVVGVVDRVPEPGTPYGFISLPERGEQVAFFAGAQYGADDIGVGDTVSALLVPSFNWAKNGPALQAIRIECR